MKKFSKKWRLNWQDWVQGLIMFVGSSVCTFGIESINAKGLVFNWNDILKVAVIATVTYLGNKFSEGVPKAIEVDKSKTKIISKR